MPKDKRGHREGRSSSKQDTASPSGGGRSTRDQVAVPKRKMAPNNPGLIAKQDHPSQPTYQYDRCTGTKASVVSSCAEGGTAVALGHSSASECGLSCKPHELGETQG